MDLQTVEKNLKNKIYLTQTQFHADINKIIKNSFQFNKFNPDFCRLTSEFEKYYTKLINEKIINKPKDLNYEKQS